MPDPNPLPINSPQAVAQALAGRTIAVVGLSSDPSRPSYDVSRYMQRQGYRIIPVNPSEREVLGEPAYATLQDIPVPVDVVNVFRRPEHVPAVVDAALAIGAPVLWLQLGVGHQAAAEHAQAGGMAVVMDRCIKVEHAARR